MEKENYWNNNQDLTLFEPFKSFYKDDKSKDKKKSSDVMTTLYFIYDRKSPLYNSPNKDEQVRKDILGDENYKIDENLIERFKEIVLTQAERSLLAWEEKMKERDRVIKNEEYTFDKPLMQDGEVVTNRAGQVIMIPGSAKHIDTALKGTNALFKEFSLIKKELLNEDNGANEESLSESEVI